MRQRRLEQFAAQLIAQEPEGLERRQQVRAIIKGFGAGPLSGCGLEWPVQKPQGGFTMVAAIEAKFLQDAGLVGTTGALIAAVDFRQILTFGGQAQVRCSGSHAK